MNPLYISNPAKTGYLDLKTHTLYYEIRGIGKREKVLLIMGALCTVKLFAETADDISKDFETLVFDNRGVGKSTMLTPHRLQTSTMLAEDALALLDAVWPGEKIHIFGASMGGSIAQMLALKLLPLGRLASLYVTVSTRGVFLKMHLPFCLWRRLVKVIFKKDNAEHVKSLMPLLATKETLDTEMALMSTHRLTNKQAKLLRDSGVPILVHIAEKDVIVKPKEQAALAELLKAQVLRTPNGHAFAPPDVHEKIKNESMAFFRRASSES